MYPIAGAWNMTRTTSPMGQLLSEHVAWQARLILSVHARHHWDHSPFFLENLHNETPGEKVLSSSDKLTVISR
jgi:hypothetical protein